MLNLYRKDHPEKLDDPFFFHADFKFRSKRKKIIKWLRSLFFSLQVIPHLLAQPYFWSINKNITT